MNSSSGVSPVMLFYVWMLCHRMQTASLKAGTMGFSLVGHDIPKFPRILGKRNSSLPFPRASSLQHQQRCFSAALTAFCSGYLWSKRAHRKDVQSSGAPFLPPGYTMQKGNWHFTICKHINAKWNENARGIKGETWANEKKPSKLNYFSLGFQAIYLTC